MVFYNKDVQISPNLQKNTSVGVSFLIKVAVLQHETLDSDKAVSL